MTYIHRVLEETVTRYLSRFSVVGITGPRQSGKSTMLQHLLRNSYRYVTFDDYVTVQSFHSDPQRFMRVHNDRVVFDEVQKVPEIFNHIKVAVDADRGRQGKFVVTGSSQFSFMKKITESLAGRIGLLSLLPLQYREIPRKLRDESVFRGGYPELVVHNYEASEDWYSSYIETYLNRDVRDLSAIGDMREFRRCLQLLATRTSQILNLSDVARDIGVAVNTIKKWISVLEASYIVFLLPPYYKNLGKRIVKTPKVYFFDTGLVSFLTGVRDDEIFEKGPMHGAIFENYVVSEVYKRESHARSLAELFYYRTSNGLEVDLIIDRRNVREYVEIKAAETFKPQMVQALNTVRRRNEHAFLVYRGKKLVLDENLEALNYNSYLNSR